MREEPVIVKPGTIIPMGVGQALTVTDKTAVGHDGKLYQTEAWREATAAYHRRWDNRSAWRKALGLPPRGAEYERGLSDLESAVGGALSLLGF